MKNPLSGLTAALFLTLAAGCGGGGSISDSNPGGSGGQLQTFGQGLVTGQVIAARPLLAMSTGVGPTTVSGSAGGAFTKITLTPTASLPDTQIAFSNGGILWLANYDGSNMHAVLGVQSYYGNSIHPSWTNDGRIVVSLYDGSTNSQIYICNRDGSSLQALTGGKTDSEPVVSWDGTKIAFTRFGDSSGRSQIYVMNLDGTSIHGVSNGTTNDSEPQWAPDGTIFFQRTASGNSSSIYHVSSTGTGLAPSFGLGNNYPVASPVGTRRIEEQNSGGVGNLVVTTRAGSAVVTSNPSSTYYEPSCWSPDGQLLLYTNNGTVEATIEVCDFNAGNRRPFLVISGASIYTGAWEKFLGPLPIIAATGHPKFGASASGFLLGAQGTSIKSFFTFTATTPSTATLTPDPISGTNNVSYHIAADAVTGIKYMNGFTTALTTVVPASGTKGAVVLFDSNTGAVSLVLPFGKRGSSSSAAKKSGAGITYTGDFLGAYDKNGKNLAPTGAKEVTYDPASRKVTAVR